MKFYLKAPADFKYKYIYIYIYFFSKTLIIYAEIRDNLHYVKPKYYGFNSMWVRFDQRSVEM